MLFRSVTAVQYMAQRSGIPTIRIGKSSGSAIPSSKILAVVSGGIVRLSYRFLHCVRQIVRHNLLAIEIEDFLFWIFSALFLFVQIYHTTSGSIRWHFVLGVVFGAVISSVHISGVLRGVKADLHMGLSRQIVDLIRLHLALPPDPLLRTVPPV